MERRGESFVSCGHKMCLCIMPAHNMYPLCSHRHAIASVGSAAIPGSLTMTHCCRVDGGADDDSCDRDKEWLNLWHRPETKGPRCKRADRDSKYSSDLLKYCVY